MTNTKTTLSEKQEDIVESQKLLDTRLKAAKTQRVRFIALTLSVAGIIGYLIFSGMRDTMGYYVTVSEMMAQSESGQFSEKSVRMSGKVTEGAVKWDPAGQMLQFIIKDEEIQASLPVVYQGLVPDSFKQGQKVIVEGTYADGVFTAKTLLTTCASKYE